MSTGTTVIIVVVVIIVVAAVAGVMYDMRRRRLRQRFGPEYDRLVEEKGSRTKAEAELAGREKRVKGLDIRPLDPAAQARYTQQWAAIQERFVDAPQDAVAEAQRLVMTVMQERGYPTEGSDQVLADLSVEHASVLDHYRAATDISQSAAGGQASTEDLRQAMIHYRALFQELLGSPADAAASTGNGTVPVETTAGLPADDPAAAPEPAASAEPVTADPVTGDPVAAEPVTAEPVAAEPVVNEPVVNEPADVAPEPVDTPVSTAVPGDVDGDTGVPATAAADPADPADPAEPAGYAGGDAYADGTVPADEDVPVGGDDVADERETEPAATASSRPRRRRS